MKPFFRLTGTSHRGERRDRREKFNREPTGNSEDYGVVNPRNSTFRGIVLNSMLVFLSAVSALSAVRNAARIVLLHHIANRAECATEDAIPTVACFFKLAYCNSLPLWYPEKAMSRFQDKKGDLPCVLCSAS
jgi:hypothetical protein